MMLYMRVDFSAAIVGVNRCLERIAQIKARLRCCCKGSEMVTVMQNPSSCRSYISTCTVSLKSSSGPNGPGHTLQPTALVSELYIRMIRDTSIDWQSRGHFFAIAAQTIRRILVDHARSVNAQRRPKPAKRVQIDDVVLYSDDHRNEI